jgi:hypothetical protein
MLRRLAISLAHAGIVERSVGLWAAVNVVFTHGMPGMPE